eukprot:377461_1
MTEERSLDSQGHTRENRLLFLQSNPLFQQNPLLQQNIVHQAASNTWIKVIVIVALLVALGSFSATMYLLFVSIPNLSPQPTIAPTAVPTVPESTVGDYKLSAQTVSHDNWLLCNGEYVSKTEYPQLYALIGNTFGENQGEFALPKAQDNIIGIVGNSHPFGSSVGKEYSTATTSITSNNLPSHSHFITAPKPNPPDDHCTEGTTPPGPYLCPSATVSVSGFGYYYYVMY